MTLLAAKCPQALRRFGTFNELGMKRGATRRVSVPHFRRNAVKSRFESPDLRVPFLSFTDNPNDLEMGFRVETSRR